MSPPAGLWRNSEFLKLWTGQAISEIGSRISREGIPLTAVLLLGAGPLQMGLLSGAPALAVLLFGLFAGAWADRVRRRRLMIAADVARAAVLVSIPILALTGHLRLSHLYAVAALAGALGVLFDVAYQAWVPSFVDRDRLLEANSKLTLSATIAEIAGPGLTGVLVQWLTAPVAILIDALSFLVSAVSVAAIRHQEPAPLRHADEHVIREILDGLRATFSHPVLRALAIRLAVAALAGGFFSSLYVLFAIRELHLTPFLLGLVISLGGASGLVGALIATPLAHRWGVGRALLLGAALNFLSTLLVPLAHGPVTLAVAILLAGQACDAGWSIYMINDTSLRQAIAPDALLGRVNSATQVLFRGLLPAGALLSGAVAETLGMRPAMWCGAALMGLSGLALLLTPVRSIRALPEHPREISHPNLVE